MHVVLSITLDTSRELSYKFNLVQSKLYRVLGCTNYCVPYISYTRQVKSGAVVAVVFVAPAGAAAAAADQEGRGEK